MCVKPGSASYSLALGFLICEVGGRAGASPRSVPPSPCICAEVSGTWDPPHPTAPHQAKSLSVGSFSSRQGWREGGHCTRRVSLTLFTLVLLGLRSTEAQRTEPLFAATKLFAISDRTILLYPIQRVLELPFVLKACEHFRFN